MKQFRKGKKLAIIEKEVWCRPPGNRVCNCSKMEIPEEFLYAMRYHHGEGSADKYNDLLKLVRVADVFPSLQIGPWPEAIYYSTKRRYPEGNAKDSGTS